MARKKRHAPHEEHISEAWLVPYADILTLLLALFIVLFAVSQTDQKKVDEMAQAFSAAFNTGGPSMFDKAGPSAGQTTDLSSTSAQTQAYLAENEQLSQAKEVLDQMIKEQNLGDELSTALTDEGLSIRIKEKALFPSGSATLLAHSMELGKPIAALLASVPQKVIISGHTDNVPIANSTFPSNWDLSAQRSLNFMKFILTQGNLNPARFSTVGHGEFRPIASNDTEEGRAQNRRVEILILRNYQSNNMKSIQ
ncbi:flagellar motor protein MotB [Anaerosinus massiliensis]|uniref:flagellar motor protein MotB n=1 Tax=Massilibacillus massiliensis TaxID=1806837 RepID=UPI000AB36D0F|nr:flagellar motor protein MotB [Massilibacillus massiliensis]